MAGNSAGSTAVAGTTTAAAACYETVLLILCQ